MEYVFPSDFPEPNIAAASDCGESFKFKSEDAVVSTTTDANYKQTRPRATRKIRTWTYSWNGVSSADFAKLQTFWNSVGRYQAFSWTNPEDSVTYTVRFSQGLDKEWQENYPYGWQGTLVFEEA